MVWIPKYPERNDLTQLVSFWSIFGAGQGRPRTRKRNRSNDLELICVHLEGRRSIQLSYGRLIYSNRLREGMRASGIPTFLTEFLLSIASYIRHGRKTLV
jgi:hypothetical protein